ncbi:MAG: phytoene desaturase family protein [Candidatus Limnocylindria bacterium]
MPENYEAILVGGGHNGLVAAHYLARAGLKVIVLERRHVVGGPCSVLEYFPGYVGAFTNSPGSLEPKIVRDMELEHFGLRFTRPDPSMLQPFPDGRAFVAWRDKQTVVEELRSFSERDATAYYEVFEFFQALARTLKVSLFEPPPSLVELVARLKTPADEEAFAKVMLGSIKDILDERLASEEVKAVVAILAVMHNQVGPRTPGTPYMLLQRPLSLASMSVGAADDPRLQPLRGSTGLPKGGMGAITQAMQRSLEAQGVAVRTKAEVARILTVDGGVAGVALASGEEIRGQIVLSNLNPKTTLLGLIEADHIDPATRERVQSLVMRGSQFKVGLALDGLPRFAAAKTEDEVRRFAGCQFRIAPSMDYMERAWDDVKYGRWSEGPMMWGLTPSVEDPDLAPSGKHVMSINVYHAPYRLAEGDWDTERDRFGKHCIDVLAQYVPNIKDIIIDARFWSPADIERELGLVEANITHGDMVPGRMFSLRPLPGWSQYRTPLRGLYLCGSGVWPGGLVSGIPGHNASHQVLRDLRADANGSGSWLRGGRSVETDLAEPVPPAPDVSNRL